MLLVGTEHPIETFHVSNKFCSESNDKHKIENNSVAVGKLTQQMFELNLQKNPKNVRFNLNIKFFKL